MARLVTYKCPDCSGTFDFLHHPHDEPPPDYCQLCNAYMGDEPQKAPVIHLNLGKEKNKVPDRLYRQMETASEERAKDAAELLGESVADQSHLKITDLKDNTREGDTHVATKVFREAEKNLSTPVAAPVMQNPQAAQWAAETTSGPSALATRSMVDSMQRSGKLREITAAATRNGQMGKYP